MKHLKWIVCFGLLAMTSLAYAQDASKLAGTSWISTQNGMMGVGTHKSLSAGVKLTFNADGTWVSSEPIFDATRGSWKTKGDRMQLLFGDETKWTKTVISIHTDKELRLKVRRKTAAYIFDWTAG